MPSQPVWIYQDENIQMNKQTERQRAKEKETGNYMNEPLSKKLP